MTSSMSDDAAATCPIPERFGFVDLQIHAGVIFHSHDAKQCADRFGGVAHASDNLAHVLGGDVERKEDSHLVDNTRNFYRVRIIDQRPYHVLKKFLVAVYFSHSVKTIE